MKKHLVFEYLDFKEYLSVRFSTSGDSRGTRIKFAKLIHASPSYVSKIVSGKIKLMLEHIPIINEILQHDEQEAEYFTQLVLYSQAGSKKLELYFKRHLDSIREERQISADWIPDKEELSEKVHAKYYSHWRFAVIHVLTSVPQFQKVASISERLMLPPSIVLQTLDYLTKIGLVEKINDRYRNTKKNIHMNKDSDWAFYAHSNLQQFTMKKLAESSPDDNHYSVIAALSTKDVTLIRKKIREILNELMNCGKANEEVYGFSIDFFKA